MEALPPPVRGEVGVRSRVIITLSVGVDSGDAGSRFTWYLANGGKVTLQSETSAEDRDEEGRLGLS